MPEIPTPVVTDVAIQEADGGLALADEKLDTLASSLGLVGLPDGIMRRLRDLGCALDDLGVVNVVQGKAMVTMLSLHKAITRLAAEVDKTEDVKQLRSLARDLAYVADKSTRAGKALVEITKEEQEAPTPPAGNPNRGSWLPGSVVGPSVNIQVQPGGSVTVQEGARTLPEAEKPA